MLEASQTTETEEQEVGAGRIDDLIHGAWVAPEATALRELLTDLAKLFGDNTEYDEDFRKPTDYALTTTWSLVNEIGSRLVDSFPLGSVLADGDGGVRIEWIRPTRELRLAIRATKEQQQYIYHEDGGDYGVEHDVTPERLANRLIWLCQNDG